MPESVRGRCDRVERVGGVGRCDPPVDGRWFVAPSAVRIQGGGWAQGRVPIDGFVLERDDADGAVLRNDRFELVVHRRPQPGARPAIGLTATWDGATAPVVLAEVRDQRR